MREISLSPTLKRNVAKICSRVFKTPINQKIISKQLSNFLGNRVMCHHLFYATPRLQVFAFVDRKQPAFLIEPNKTYLSKQMWFYNWYCRVSSTYSTMWTPSIFFSHKPYVLWIRILSCSFERDNIWLVILEKYFCLIKKVKIQKYSSNITN